MNPSGVIKAIGIDGRRVSRQMEENAHGVTYWDVPLCMMDKPSSNGFWTRIQRQLTRLWVDESTGAHITSSSEKSRNQPGQLIDPPLDVFWSLYTLRCEQTSKALRNTTRAAATRLLLATQHVASPNSTTDYHLEKHQFDGMRVAIAREFPHAPARLQDGIAAVCLTAAILAKAVQEVLGPDKNPPWPACWEE